MAKVVVTTMSILFCTSFLFLGGFFTGIAVDADATTASSSSFSVRARLEGTSYHMPSRLASSVSSASSSLSSFTTTKLPLRPTRGGVFVLLGHSHGNVLDLRGGETSLTAAQDGDIASRQKKTRKTTGGSKGKKDSEDERGGETTKKKKSKKKKTHEIPSDKSTDEGRKAINTAMREKDYATTLGDAIRNRGDILRSDRISIPSNTLTATSRIDQSLSSVGFALGTSDSTILDDTTTGASLLEDDREKRKKEGRDYVDDNDDDRKTFGMRRDNDEGGGVHPSSTAVLANYFLKSHGGAHGVQCLASLLSVLAGVGAILVPPPPLLAVAAGSDGWSGSGSGPGMMKLILVRRALLCALAKHASGLIAAAILSASRIPSVGLRNTRRKIEELALDPVSQYLFYCSLLLVWMPAVVTKGGRSDGKGGDKGSAMAPLAVPWWLGGAKMSRYCIPIMLGPILLREVVSTAWVISDIFVILNSSASTGDKQPLPLRWGRNTVDALMSLLFTPSRWRGSDSATRQRLLAKLVSRTSLGLEVVTGIILLYDAMRAFLDYALSPVNERPQLLSVVKRIACARLYVNFLLVRRKKIRDLVSTIRGGAVFVPGRVLDALLEPRKAMGLDDGRLAGRWRRCGENGTGDTERTWLDYAAMALGFEE